MNFTCYKILRVIMLLAAAAVFFASKDGFAEDKYIVKHVGSYNGVSSGKGFGRIYDIFVDDEAKEIYVLDAGNRRVVLLDLYGVPLYWFNLSGQAIESSFAVRVSRKTGKIYVATEQGYINVYDYKGRLIETLDFKKHNISIRSMDFNEEDDLFRFGYLSKDGNKNVAGIVVADLRGDIKKKMPMGNYMDVKDITFFNGNYYFLVPGGKSVVGVDAEGKEFLRFGRESSLLGGFSQPTAMSMSIDGKVLVADSNRMLVIGFDSTGKALFEFGGPTILLWPSKVAIDENGRVYVTDRGNSVMIYEVYREGEKGRYEKVGGKTPVTVTADEDGKTGIGAVSDEISPEKPSEKPAAPGNN